MGAMKNLIIEVEEQAAWDIENGEYPMGYADFRAAMGLHDNKLSRDVYKYHYLGDVFEGER